ncbi:protein kinase-like protein [Klebsiella michiganensis]|nr:protein kinase-like protein [Klebsiella michiganensis]
MTAISPYRRCRPAFLERQPIYQLYTLLNRAILFGGQHLVTAQKALDEVFMDKAP